MYLNSGQPAPRLRDCGHGSSSPPARSGACSVYHANRSLAGAADEEEENVKPTKKGRTAMERKREGATSEFWLHADTAAAAAARVINIMEKRKGGRPKERL